MTPRQRRLHRAGLRKVAAAPRKSWLGRFTPLNGIQSAWIKSLLTVWGEGMREVRPRANHQDIHAGEV